MLIPVAVVVRPLRAILLEIGNLDDRNSFSELVMCDIDDMNIYRDTSSCDMI